MSRELASSSNHDDDSASEFRHLLSGGGSKPGHSYRDVSITGSGTVHLGDSIVTESLFSRIPYAAGAIFNSRDVVHDICHPATRTDLLHQIKDWCQQPDSKRIFWLSGMAGTGKSTISWTIATWLTDLDNHREAKLGASFFFKRGEGDRGSAALFFPTLVRQLVLNVPELSTLLGEAIDSDPWIFEKALAEQFKTLILRPFQKLNTNVIKFPILILVDALDECESERDVRTILQLWSSLSQMITIPLRLFITSRPELPVRLGFAKISNEAYQDFVLHDIPKQTIQHDLAIYLSTEFDRIRGEHNESLLSMETLSDDWPGRDALNRLVKLSSPLFIVAATISRFIGDLNWDPTERLAEILATQTAGQMSQMEQTYLPVLKQLTVSLTDSHEADRLYFEFRYIVGSIVCLLEPLSVANLASLLNESPDFIRRRLSTLHSVLLVPTVLDDPIQALHLSFPEFLLSSRSHMFGVNGPATHLVLRDKCIEFLSGTRGLRKNMCGLRHAGQPRQKVGYGVIAGTLLPAIQYACRYWIHHVQQSQVPIDDVSGVYAFLQKHFLHWLEALSLMNRIGEALPLINLLQTCTRKTAADNLSAFLEDCRRFVLANRYIVNLAPLQLYSSALIFAPEKSPVKTLYSHGIDCLAQHPVAPNSWGLELLRLEEHDREQVTALAFSPDNTVLASTTSGIIRLWNTRTGQELQALGGREHAVTALAFCPKGTFLVSSYYSAVRLWNPETGQVIKTLGEGFFSAKPVIPMKSVSAVSVSPDSTLIALGSWNSQVRLWDHGKEQVYTLAAQGRNEIMVCFAPQGDILGTVSGATICIWNYKTKQILHQLEGDGSLVNTLAFSRDGSFLVSTSYDCVIRLWDPRNGQRLQTVKTHQFTHHAVCSPTNSLLALALADCTVQIWDWRRNHEMREMGRYSKMVRAMHFSPDGSLLALATDNTVRLLSFNTNEDVQVFDGHRSRVKLLTFSPDSTLVASVADDRTVLIWNASTGRKIQTLTRFNDGHPVRMIFSPNNAILALLSDNVKVRLWYLQTGKQSKLLENHTQLLEIYFAPDASFIATFSSSGIVATWDPQTGQSLEIRHLLRGSYEAFAFCPQSNLLLTSSSSDDMLTLWDTRSCEKVRVHKRNREIISSLAFSPNGEVFASALDRGLVILWDLQSGEIIWSEHHADGLLPSPNIVFSPRGSLLASVSKHGTIRIWECHTSREVVRLKHFSGFRNVSFSSDESCLLSDQGVIRIHKNVAGISKQSSFLLEDQWFWRDGLHHLWLPPDFRPNCSAFRDGRFAVGTGTGRVYFLKFNGTLP